MPKLDRTHKNYLILKIWEEIHLREIFYSTLIFQQSSTSMICIGSHVGGHTFALQHGGQNYFLLISCLMFDSYVQVCYKRYHIIFSTFWLKFKCKICVRKRLFIFLKKSSFGHVTSHGLSHFEQMVGVWKTKSLLFCLRDDPLIVFRMQNHVTFIFIKTMSRDLLVQVAFLAAVISVVTAAKQPSGGTWVNFCWVYMCRWPLRAPNQL